MSPILPNKLRSYYSLGKEPNYASHLRGTNLRSPTPIDKMKIAAVLNKFGYGSARQISPSTDGRFFPVRTDRGYFSVDPDGFAYREDVDPFSPHIQELINIMRTYI